MKEEFSDDIDMGIVFIVPDDTQTGDLIVRFPDTKSASIFTHDLAAVIASVNPDNTRNIHVTDNDCPVQIGISDRKYDSEERFQSLLKSSSAPVLSFSRKELLADKFVLIGTPEKTEKQSSSFLDGILPTIGMATLLLFSTIVGIALASEDEPQEQKLLN